MAKPYDIAIVGRGGQGVIFLARLLGEGALLQGIPVRVTESHGMAVRGGSVATFIRLGEAAAPLFPAGTADLLIALDPRETAAGLPALGPGASVLINAPTGRAPELPPGGLRLFTADAGEVARALGAPRSANIALLGAAASVPGFPVGREALARALGERGRDRERGLAILRGGAGAIQPPVTGPPPANT